jgi:hypothetical protein
MNPNEGLFLQAEREEIRAQILKLKELGLHEDPDKHNRIARLETWLGRIQIRIDKLVLSDADKDLRDGIAIAAMVAELQSREDGGIPNAASSRETIAELAYGMADVMMVARKGGQP